MKPGISRTNRRLLIAVVVCAAGVVGQLVALRSLEYSSVSLNHVELADVMRGPEHGAYRLGSLVWDTHAYEIDPRLAPLREYVRQHCSGKTPHATGLCLAEAFADEFPVGGSSYEFLQPSYDVAAAFRRHTVDSEPGHCIQRSALMAASLLSAGRLARVVQILPNKGGRGHTLIEVWEKNNGWQMIDPMYGSYAASSGGRPLALATLLGRSTTDLNWKAVRSPRWPAGTMPDVRVGYRDLVHDAQLLYPDPWMYTRTGARAPSWPLRSAFAYTGARNFVVGPLHKLLHAGTIVAALGGCLSLWFVASSLLKDRRRRMRLARAHQHGLPWPE